MLEMGQKAGTAGVTHHESRGLFLNEWFGLTAPWTAIASLAVVWPFLRRNASGVLRDLSLPWWWAVV